MPFEKTTVENEIENGTFVDRRAAKKQDSAGGFERHQFPDGHEEMIQIIKSIGYAKS